MQIRTFLMALLYMSFSLSIHAQTDSATNRMPSSKSKKTFNFTKLELVYKKEIDRYTTPNYSKISHLPDASIYSTETHYNPIDVPYIRINGGELRRLDKHANILKPYYTKAPLANEQLLLMNKQLRRASVQGWTVVGLGIVGMVGGAAMQIRKDNKRDDDKVSYGGLLLHIAPGLTVTALGYALHRHHTQKSKKHLEESVEIYNKQYYKPARVDSTGSVSGGTDSSLLLTPTPPKN